MRREHQPLKDKLSSRMEVAVDKLRLVQGQIEENKQEIDRLERQNEKNKQLMALGDNLTATEFESNAGKIESLKQYRKRLLGEQEELTRALSELKGFREDLGEISNSGTEA